MGDLFDYIGNENVRGTGLSSRQARKKEPMEKEFPVLSVTEFYLYVNELLGLEEVLVEGEISEIKVAKGYLVYFTIKDAENALPCLAFKNKLDAIGLSIEMLEVGMNIKVVGVPNVYAKRGEFKLVVQKVILAGEGALKRAFELLKKKLEEEGLFKQELKRPIPSYPETIGLITSQGAAAYTDFLKVLKARWGGVSIYFYHTSVQGETAIQEILEAFRFFNSRFSHLDAIVLTRGGGSLEDLAAFNAEAVVRAIRESKWPVICAVGHERDLSLSDFAADLRASTPSNAAELLAPTRQEEKAFLESLEKKLLLYMERKVTAEKQFLEHGLAIMERFFQKPKIELLALDDRLMRGIAIWFSRIKNDLLQKERLLKSFDPLAVLKRGYSITTNEKGKVVISANEVEIDEVVTTSLYQGIIHSQVKKIQ